MYDKRESKKTAAILFIIGLLAVLAGILTLILGDHRILPILCFIGGIVVLGFAVKFNRAAGLDTSESCGTQAGAFDPMHARVMQFYRQLADLQGIQKRTRMLEEEKSILEDELHRLEQEKTNLGKHSRTSAPPQVALKNQKAIVGVVANGLVGRSAGVGTTVDVMRENEQIVAQNQTGAQSHTEQLEQWARDLTEQIGHTRDSIADCEQQIKESKDKLVLETVPTEVLFDALELDAAVQKADNQKSLVLNVSICNHFKADADGIPDSVSWAVDGMLDASIYFEGKLVDVIPVALPAKGIPCKGAEEQMGSETVTAYSEQCMDTDGAYTVKFAPKKLWLAEV